MTRCLARATESQEGLKATADEIRGLCAVITKIARSDLQQRLERCGAGISAIEHGVLRRMAGGAETMADVSRLMGVPASTLVYVIDRLASRGLVSRGKDSRDRRREPLSLEAKGKKLLARIPDMDGDSVLVKSLARMGSRQRGQMRALLRAFAAGLASGDDLTSELQRIVHPRAPTTGRAKHRRLGPSETGG